MSEFKCPDCGYTEETLVISPDELHGLHAHIAELEGALKEIVNIIPTGYYYGHFNDCVEIANRALK